ncbi:hypothetical protein LZ554_000068 [Drepanopeziza brunnea f. sp. 'monogermtubi']|nr:hypothetical protein LZ554_000068 [Drepanopeziza brunnea f. sp. 'monogermtubi']
MKLRRGDAQFGGPVPFRLALQLLPSSPPPPSPSPSSAPASEASHPHQDELPQPATKPEHHLPTPYFERSKNPTLGDKKAPSPGKHQLTPPQQMRRGRARLTFQPPTQPLTTQQSSSSESEENTPAHFHPEAHPNTSHSTKTNHGLRTE